MPLNLNRESLTNEIEDDLNARNDNWDRIEDAIDNLPGPGLAWRVGMKIDKNNSDPDARVEYLYDAVGMTPASMNFGTGSFNYGSWQQFCESINKPVMLNYNGSVAYELDRDNQTLKADGTASDITNTAFGGNAMSQFKLLWLKEYESGNYQYIIFSNVKYDNDYHAHAFTDQHGGIRDQMYYAMFEGSYDGTRLRSLATGSFMHSQAGATEIARAAANGDGWYINYKSQRDFVTYLLWLISKSTNDQAKFGLGNSQHPSSTVLDPGEHHDKPQFYGVSANAQTPVKVFYIENYWGNAWNRMAGLLLDDSHEIFVQQTAPYTVASDNSSAGHTATGVTPTGTSGDPLSKASISAAFGLVPMENGGTTSQNYCAGFWHTTPAAGDFRFALVGGRRTHGAGCGAAAVALADPLSFTSSSRGAALSFLENAS